MHLYKNQIVYSFGENGSKNMQLTIFAFICSFRKTFDKKVVNFNLRTGCFKKQKYEFFNL